MGQLLENMCCISNKEIIDNRNYVETYRGKSKEIYDENLKKERLPSNQICFVKSTSDDKQQVKNTSDFPIYTKDVIVQKKGDPFQDYEIIQKIGEGTFGKVYKVKNKYNNNIRALKQIDKHFLKNINDSEVVKEIEILKKLHHPYIMKLYEYYVNNDYIFLISELCEEGDLYNKIRKIGKFPEFIVKVIMLQVFKALMYLNQKHVIHGDLKLENILVVCYDYSKNEKYNKKDKDGFINAINHDINLIMEEENLKTSYNVDNYSKTNDKIKRVNKKLIERYKRQETYYGTNFRFGGKKDNNSDDHSVPQKLKNIFDTKKFKIFNYGIKLIDFGCSKIFTRYKRNFDDIVGTLMYCSPEVLANDYNESCDVWACGVLMFYLLSGHFPFDGEDEESITSKILSGKFEFDIELFNDVSDEAKDLITKCLKYDIARRIKIQDAINHKFFDILKNSKTFTKEEIKKLKSLKLYNENSKFYQLVFTYLSYNFSDNKLLNDLNNIYSKIDKNCDWKITKGELFKAYKNAGIPTTLNEIDKIISLMDFDKNGTVDYEEFIRMCIPRDRLFTEENLENAFLLFDKDKKGFITPNEIISIIEANRNVSKEAKQAIREEILEISDEIIDFNEFKNLMLSLSKFEKKNV